MKYKFFAVSACAPDSSAEELNAFCSQHRVSFVEKHWVADGANSFWSICVTWLDGEAAPSASIQKKSSIDYKQVLSETDFGLYIELRNLRKELADSYGVPPYALFTNEQLAAMVEQRIRNKTALQAIPGVGKSRVEKYGDQLLQKLTGFWERDIPEGDDEAHSDRS